MKPGKKGFARIIDATGYSWKGLKAAWKNEAAFRQELVAVVILTPAAVYIANSLTQLVLLLTPLFILLIAELVNSALEAVVDRISEEHHELSGRAKDIGSAVVFIALLLSFTTWSLIILDNYVF